MKACCQDKNNLKPVKQPDGEFVPTCQVCGCRHFEFVAEASTLFAKPK
jgi:hypothetical protein